MYFLINILFLFITNLLQVPNLLTECVMDDYNFNFGGDEEVTDEGENNWEYGGRNATVYLIDAANEMFKAEEGKDSPFIISLKVCFSIYYLNV